MPNFFLMPDGSEPPEEFMQAVHQQQEHVAMLNLVHKTAVKNLFDSLDAEQLVVLKNMFQHVYVVGGEAALYYRSTAEAILRYQRDVCPECGLDHVEELFAHSEMDPAQQAEPKTDAQLALEAQMQEYGLEWFHDDDQGIDYLRCINCEKFYPSLDDRMMKPPGVEGCDGCQMKAKWGSADG